MGSTTGSTDRMGSAGRAGAVLAETGAGEARSLVRRAVGAARLDPSTWAGIAADPVPGQAALVVAAAAAANALAAGGASAPLAALGSLASWLLIAAALWAAANGLGHRLGIATALRLVGFAMAPLALLVLAAIPVAPVQAAVRLVALALFLAALLAGTRQALRVETMRATLVCATAGLGLVFLAMLVLAMTVSPA